MGRRSRKRAGAAVAEPRSPRAEAERPPARRPPARRVSRRGEPPPAPWGRFPLAELCILLSLIMGIAGFVVWGHRGQIMVACAAALGSIAGLEVSIREHLAGYRSHSTLLAAAIAMATIAAMFFARAPRAVLLAVGAAVFATAFVAVRELFKRRSGGAGFR